MLIRATQLVVCHKRLRRCHGAVTSSSGTQGTSVQSVHDKDEAILHLCCEWRQQLNVYLMWILFVAAQLYDEDVMSLQLKVTNYVSLMASSDKSENWYETFAFNKMLVLNPDVKHKQLILIIFCYSCASKQARAAVFCYLFRRSTENSLVRCADSGYWKLNKSQVIGTRILEEELRWPFNLEQNGFVTCIKTREPIYLNDLSKVVRAGLLTIFTHLFKRCV